MSDDDIMRTIYDQIPKPWDTHDGASDQPGHVERVDVRLYMSYPDAAFNRECVAFYLHGTDNQLCLVVDAIIADGWEPLTYFDPEPCQPAFGCMHLITIHAGHPDITAVAAALSLLTGIDGSDNVPWFMPIAPRGR
jgi:hypothetical protein